MSLRERGIEPGGGDDPVPGRPVGIGRFDHRRERLVARAPQLGGGGMPHHRARQRVGEGQSVGIGERDRMPGQPLGSGQHRGEVRRRRRARRSAPRARYRRPAGPARTRPRAPASAAPRSRAASRRRRPRRPVEAPQRERKPGGLAQDPLAHQQREGRVEQLAAASGDERADGAGRTHADVPSSPPAIRSATGVSTSASRVQRSIHRQSSTQTSTPSRIAPSAAATVRRRPAPRCPWPPEGPRP